MPLTKNSEAYIQVNVIPDRFLKIKIQDITHTDILEYFI